MKMIAANKNIYIHTHTGYTLSTKECHGTWAIHSIFGIIITKKKKLEKNDPQTKEGNKSVKE